MSSPVTPAEAVRGLRQELEFAHAEGLLPDQYERAIGAVSVLARELKRLAATEQVCLEAIQERDRALKKLAALERKLAERDMSVLSNRISGAEKNDITADLATIRKALPQHHPTRDRDYAPGSPPLDALDRVEAELRRHPETLEELCDLSLDALAARQRNARQMTLEDMKGGGANQ